MMLLLALALLATARRRWWWAGVAVALTTLTWQPVFFPAFVAVVGAALMAERGTRLRALGGVALGGALTAAAMAAYFAARRGARGVPGRLRADPPALHLPARSGRRPRGAVGGHRRGVRHQPQPRDRRAGPAGAARRGGGRRPAPTSRPAVPHPGGVRRRHPGGAVLELPDLQRLGRRADAACRSRRSASAAWWPWSTSTSPGGSAWCSPRCGSWWSGRWVSTGRCTRARGSCPSRSRRSSGSSRRCPPDATAAVDRGPPAARAHRPDQPDRAADVPRSGWRSTSTTPGPAAWRATPRPCATRAPTVVAVGRGARYPWLMPTLLEDYTAFGTSPGWYWYVRDDVGAEHPRGAEVGGARVSRAVTRSEP